MTLKKKNRINILIMMKKTLLTLAAVLSCTTAFAQNKNTLTQDMVVATVNKQAITLQELKNRITLSKLLVNRELSNAEFNVLKQQAVEQLVDEEIKRQFAEKKKITVSSTELNNAVKFIEQQRKLEENTLLKKIPANLRESAIKQIKDSIIQQKIIHKVVMNKIFVPDYEIDTLLENAINQAHTKEYKISQILIENTKQPAQDTKKAAKLYQELIAGAKFDDLVIAFSDGPNKIQGGSLGWFSLNELNFKLQKAVSRLTKGEFSKPVKGKDGWFIVKLDDIKVTENIDTSETEEFKYISFSAKQMSKAKFDTLKQDISQIRGFSDFKEFKKNAMANYSLKITDADKWLTEKDITPEALEIVKETLPGNFANFKLNADKSVNFIYMVDRKLVKSEQVLAIRKRIENNLQAQKAERKFKQLMKDLKAKAFIELR